MAAIAWSSHDGYHHRKQEGHAPAISLRRRMGSVVKKRRKKMSKHKHRKRLKKSRWQRRHK